MCVVCFSWQCLLFYGLGGKVSCMFYVAMCVVGSYRWQSELYFLGGNVCCMFYLAMGVVVCCRWQCVLLHLLGGKVSCCMF